MASRVRASAPSLCLGLVLASFLAACGSSADQDIPEEIRITDVDRAPRPAELGAPGIPATGPAFEVIRASSVSGAVRVVGYLSADGPCVLTEIGDQGEAIGCGPSPGDPRNIDETGTFGWFSSTSGEGRPYEVVGLVVDEVATTWIVGADGRRYPTVMASLGPAQIDAQAFFGLTPQGIEPQAVVGIDADGETVVSFPVTSGPGG